MPVHSSLIAPRELEEMLGSVTVLDVRWKLGGPPGADEFRRGHVPGASYVDLEADLADPAGAGGRHPLPGASRFAEGMRRCGVRDEWPVVVYDDASGRAAARCWWLLRYFGHRQVWLLDGGYSDWVGEGLPVEEGAVVVSPGDFSADPGHMAVLDAPGAARVAREGVLIDARAPERFRGEVEPVDAVAGHIPGAVNVPTGENLHGDPGRFKPLGDLVRAYGCVDGRGEVGAYCGSGVTAAHDVFALDLIGVHAALYPGSWSEWVADPDRPVATGGSQG